MASDVVISGARAIPGDARHDCLIVHDCPHSSDGRIYRYFNIGGYARQDCLIVPDSFIPPMAADVVISAAGTMPGDSRQDCLIVPDCPHSSDSRIYRYFNSGGFARHDCLIVSDSLMPPMAADFDISAAGSMPGMTV